jgi:hypothetical protein
LAKRTTTKSTRDITPDSRVTMSLTQVLFVVGGVFIAALGWGVVVWGQHSQASDIATIQTKLDTVTTATQKVSQDQDTKREQMGKDFLSSQDKIVEQINKLNTAVAVEQTTQKTMADTLTTISNQIGELTKFAPQGTHK